MVIKFMNFDKGTFGLFPAHMLMGIDAHQQIVFTWLCFHANKDNICFPSIKTLCVECNLSNPTICKALRGLERIGYIQRAKRNAGKTKSYTSTLYKIICKNNLSPGGDNITEVTNDISKVTNDISKVTNDVSKGLLTTLARVTNDVSTNQIHINQTHVEQKEENQNHEPNPPISPPLGDGVILSEKVLFANFDNIPVKSLKKPKPVNKLDEAAFNKFYGAYPLHKSKEAAKKAFAKIKMSPELLQQMLEAIELQKQERRNKELAGIFVPEWKHPSTWLNGKCWEDEVRLTINVENNYDRRKIQECDREQVREFTRRKVRECFERREEEQSVKSAGEESKG